MKKNPSKLLIWLSVILLSMIWGSTWLAIKIGLRDTPPFFSAALRFIIASLGLLAYMKYKKLKFPATFQFWKRSVLLALFMFIIPYAFVYWGEMHISSGLSSVLFSSQSLFVVLCSHYLLAAEKAAPVKWLGLLAGMAGLVFIFYTRFGITTDLGVLGMLGILAAALSAAFALVWLRKIGGELDHVTELTSQICVTALFFILLSPCLEKFPRDLSPASLWLCVAYLGIVGTSLSFLIYYWLAKHTTALILSFSVYLTPVLALFLGWFFLNEYIGANDLVGASIVILSIVVTQSNIKFTFKPGAVFQGDPGAARPAGQVNEN